MATRDDVRRMALSLPETTEADHFDAPSFRVGKRIFAVLREPDGVTIRLDPGDRHNLVAGRPGVVEPVSGKGARVAGAARAGWTFVRYDLCEEAEIAGLLRLAWSSVAPMRLSAAVDPAARA